VESSRGMPTRMARKMRRGFFDELAACWNSSNFATFRSAGFAGGSFPVSL